MTHAEEINVKIVYEIPDTRDPLTPSLPAARSEVTHLRPYPPPPPVSQLAPFQQLFNDHDQSQ